MELRFLDRQGLIQSNSIVPFKKAPALIPAKWRGRDER